MNLSRLLEMSAQRCPSGLALVEGEVTLSYGELVERSDRIAAGLGVLGAGPGERVVLLLGNSLDHALVTTACARSGAVVVPVNPRAARGELTAVLREAGPAVLVYEDPDLPELLGAPGMPDAVRLVGAGDAEQGAPYRFSELAATEPVRSREPEEDDLSCILYTSGTTGRPKGLPHTHRNVYARTVAWILHFGPPASEPYRVLGTAPLHHITGLHVALWTVYLQAGSWHGVPDRTPTGVLGQIEREQLTYVLGVPTLFERWYEAAAAAVRPYDLTSVRLAVTASAPRPPGFVSDVQALFPNARLCEAYGNTEGVMLGSVDLVRRPGALRSVGDLEARIIRPGGHPDDLVAADEEGELVVSLTSARVIGGYLDDEQATRSAFRDGYMHTGDAFRRAADGTLWLVGRLDDMFISGGENIHPSEVEQVLALHPGVADVCVLGIPDPTWGQVCTAFVVRSDPELDVAALDLFCRESGELAAYKRPRTVIFVDQLPKNHLGKVMRHVLRDRLAREDEPRIMAVSAEGAMREHAG